MIKNKIIFIFFISICVIVVIILLYNYVYHSRENFRQHLILGSSLQPLSGLIFVADKKGFFSDNGLNVEIKNYASGADAVDDLLNDKINLSLMTEFAFAKQIMAGQDLVVLASIATADMQEVITRQESGINKLSDLKGKKVALKKNSSSEFWLSRTLLYNNLQDTDIEKIYLEVADLLPALENGEVDAVITWQPHVYNIEKKLGNKVAVWSAQNNQDLYWLLVAKKDFLTDNKNAITAFIKSVIDSEVFLKDNNEDYSIIKYMLDVDEDFIKTIVRGQFRFHVGLSQSLILVLEDISRWLISASGKEIFIPNYLNYIDMNFLINLYPESVLIIK